MKKVLIFLLLVLMLIAPVFAESQYVSDGEKLLLDEVETQLSEKLQDLSHKYDMELFIVTASGFGGRSIERYAEECWKKLSRGKDGVLFLFSMTKREYDIYCAGRGEDIFKNEALDKLEDAVVSQLKAEYPAGAANAFVNTAKSILEDYEKEKASWTWKTPLICFGAGAVVALIVVLVMAAQHKSVRRKAQAGDYVIPGSFQLSQCLDLYLYQTTTRRRRTQSSGSSGGSSGGGGGSSRGGGSHRSGRF